MYKDVIFKEEAFSVQTFSDYESKVQAYKLRHEVFAQTLQWVPESKDGLEYDEYDKYAIHFGVFKQPDELTSYMRLILPHDLFMLEKIDTFRNLLPRDYVLNKKSAAEISRFCTRDDNRRNAMVKTQAKDFSQSILLLKGVYHWCNLNDIRYLYAVTEYKIHRLFKSYGFPFKNIIERPFYAMPDGTKVTIISLDWREFEEETIMKNRELHKMFKECHQYPKDHGTLLQQPSEDGSPCLI